MSELIGWWDEFLWGTLVVLKVFFVALVMAIVFGLLGASAKLSKSRIAQSIASGYTIVFRGTPELLVLLIFYFGSAITLTSIAQTFDPSVKFVDIPPFWAGAFAVGLIVGAYATETFRGAFLGVDPGHIEAARALGISTPPLATALFIDRYTREAVPYEIPMVTGNLSRPRRGARELCLS